jgi:hypothetical protein
MNPESEELKKNIFSSIDGYINKLLELRTLIMKCNSLEEMDKALTEYQGFLAQEFPKTKKVAKKPNESKNI